jgi:hypothetical protein
MHGRDNRSLWRNVSGAGRDWRKVGNPLVLMLLIAGSLVAGMGIVVPSSPPAGAATQYQYNYGQGFVMVGSKGGAYAFGQDHFYGSAVGTHLNAPMVGGASTTNWAGYWMVGSDGGIFSYGNAQFYGSEGGQHLNKPIVGMVGTGDNAGYMLVGADGGTFAFGDSYFYGSLPGDHVTPVDPVVEVASTRDGGGYWMVTSGGGVFCFGDAQFYGSLPSTHITPSQPIVAIAPTIDGNGYWLVGKDGGVFAFGDAPAYGTPVPTKLPVPIVGPAGPLAADPPDTDRHRATGTRCRPERQSRGLRPAEQLRGVPLLAAHAGYPEPVHRLVPDNLRRDEPGRGTRRRRDSPGLHRRDERPALACLRDRGQRDVVELVPDRRQPGGWHPGVGSARTQWRRRRLL